MDILQQEEGDVLVLSPGGRLDGTTAPEFETVLLGRIGEGRTRAVIDFGRLDYISSAGLRVLLMAAKRMRQTDGRLVLCAVKAHILEVFEISGFLSIFTVETNRDAAVAAAAA
ncbi:STAS domain-containing protein [Roseospira visakhapatnamensis]|uniref:Anti-sigma factor antagonist n=1 Tax=Roseospira visakhapatnamensis TaxID=390880 RepID=A0A7W6RA36_9PROT|nr:STAS domain-containing protein [Roseospira visakhapatnamensis]MBB4264745.1 anti-sigma B factor antagonist [Roseospira visakhapatnamensis]